MAKLECSTVILFVVIAVVTIFINSASSQPLAKASSRTSDSVHMFKRSVGSCATTCTKTKRVVCGSDGVTYDNPCQFKDCGKRRNANLQISHQGPC